MRKVSLAVSLVVGLSLVAQAATAQTRQWKFGPEVNFATNSVGFGVGGRAVYTGLGTALKVPGLQAYGAFDWFFPGSGLTWWELNANGTWDIPNMTGFNPYVGAGLNFAHVSVNCGPLINCSSSNVGLNLLGGARFNVAQKLEAFGEVRAEIRSGSAIVFTVGVLF
jgi:opacity protein-like surface antigen